MLYEKKCIILLVYLSSNAFAGLVVDLVPQPSIFFPIGAGYAPGEVVLTDVFLRNDQPGESIQIRYLQFDFSHTDPHLGISLPHSDEQSSDVRFWNIGIFGCKGCYSIDDDIIGDPPNIISIEWIFDFPLEEQIILPGDGSNITIGVLEVTMPNSFDFFLLDLLNAGETDPTLGAELRFGFGEDDPFTVWRAEDGQISGGSFKFLVGVPEPSTLMLLAIGGSLLALRRWKKN